MPTLHRAILLTVLATFVPTLVACSGGFDPDKLDIFGLSEKKKLPGERKELFPGGVPGVTQGIPSEFMKGNQPPADAALPSADQGKAAGGAEPPKKTAGVEPEEPKPKPKRAPKPRTTSQPTQVTVSPTPQQQPAPWPDPQPAQQQSQSLWPTPPAQGQTNAAAPWPSSPPPGTFSR